jgi:hypothetical protein
MEVAKTRLQLDGELMSKGSPKTYTNPIDVLRKIVRNEGFRACQKGLGAAVSFSSRSFFGKNQFWVLDLSFAKKKIK